MVPLNSGPTLRRASDFLPWLVPFWIAGVLLFHLRILACWSTAQRLRRAGVCCAPDVWQQRLNRLGASLWISARNLPGRCLCRNWSSAASDSDAC